eukprot:CAMPEP_0195523846 /NCGR_PEP_ID=MMETSP0794_2-20130614/23304_1 /TAXON_ID=515487 /ORGANISM="Stephanopyxis turris, Strain CCMP 815" /LENGTH=945 /DNA_ID=CAMNT_0040653933 /DNA_START=90 /DNA_END=2927 /DNA_ORIENTATION=+
MRPVLPNRGIAVVKSVLSGDTVTLLGRATAPDAKAPEVVFTFERVTAPRMASKANSNRDDPGAFPAREWLRGLCVGKSVSFETRKQGATAGDRVYGLLFFPSPEDSAPMNLAVESVRRGHAIPKVFGDPEKEPVSNDNANSESNNGDNEPIDPIQNYERQLQLAFQEAKSNQVGVHSPSPLVRELKNAVDDFVPSDLVNVCLSKKTPIKCVLEYIFDGSRYRCLIADENPIFKSYLHSSFTMILAGVSCPRVGNSRIDPPTQSEPLADEARQFVELRLLHRELSISLHGTDKSGACVVGTVHHPRGSIAVELLKKGLGRVSDWSARIMDPLDLPALRVAENSAKRTNTGVWVSYSPPELSGASEITGVVVEVLTGDTLAILPNGVQYDDESKLCKVSLASVRAPRIGNEKIGKVDEPYAAECKDRLRVLTVGKQAKVTVHYERDIPMGQNSVTRQFGTISVPKKEDVGEILISEGLAVTQRHRDDDEKSPRYDILCLAENNAKAAKKGVHSDKDYGHRNSNDLTNPQKAKSYSGSLMRSGSLKAIVEYVFNGSRFKVFIPSENCHIVFALENLRCPQPSPNVSSNAARGPVKEAEPFGDISKRHARLSVLQRNVELVCGGVTMGGVITGQLFVGTGAQRRDYSLELLGAGYATIDQRKIDYGEVSKVLIDAQTVSQSKKIGLWSLEQTSNVTDMPTVQAKIKEEVISVRLSEIRNGRQFFYQVVGSEAAGVVDESMKLFTSNHGISGGACDVRNGKIVAALFDDGSGKSWYRAKIVERKDKGKVAVLFIDHGNIGVVPISTHLRPLDTDLGVDKIPPVAKEALLALTHVRSLDEDDGFDAAKMLQNLAWGKDMSIRKLCELDGKLVVTMFDPATENAKTINEQLVAAGLARVPKQVEVNTMIRSMADGSSVKELSALLTTAQDQARKSRSGMWRYGDIGDDDEEI